MKKSTTLIRLSLAATAMAAIYACTDGNAKPKANIVTKDAPGAGIAAKIGGVQITEEELIGDAKSELFELKKREYDIKMDRVQRLMEEKLIGAEAKSANLSVDEFINKKVAGNLTVSEAEYKKFVEEKKIPADQLKQHPEYKDKINDYLKNMKKTDAVQAYLAKLTKSNPVEVYFKKPVQERVAVDITGAPVAGGKDAKVTIVEYSDFQCPYCSKGSDVVNALKKKYGNKIKVAFKHYPLPFHTDAEPAHQASLCVRKLGGDDKFWKFHDITFKNQAKLAKDDLYKYAKEAGVDDAKVKACVEANEFKAAVAADIEYGNKIGVRSTPTFFVNGLMLAGALPVEEFSEMIDEELKK